MTGIWMGLSLWKIQSFRLLADAHPSVAEQQIGYQFVETANRLERAV